MDDNGLETDSDLEESIFRNEPEAKAIYEQRTKTPQQKPMAVKKHASRLERELEERDIMIQNMAKKLVEETDVSSQIIRDVITHMDLKDTKVTELAKKVRRLTVALEKEKIGNDTMCQQIKQYAKWLEEAKQKLIQSKNGPLDHSKCEENMQQLRDKLAAVTRRLEDERIQTHALRQELKQTQKALSLELGEESPDVAAIVESGGQWKGRAQKILTLKERVRVLKQKLAQATGVEDDDNQSVMTMASSSVTEARQRVAIERIERERRLQMAQQLREMETMKAEIRDGRTKQEATSARNRLLQKQVSSLKSHLQTLLAKSGSDDELIQALQVQLSKQVPHSTHSASNSNPDHDDALSTLKALCADQQARLSTQSREMTRLRDMLTQWRSHSRQSQRLDDDWTLERESLIQTQQQMQAQLAASEEKYQQLLQQLYHSSSATNTSNVNRLDDDFIQKLQDKLAVALDDNAALKATLEAQQKQRQQLLNENRRLDQALPPLPQKQMTASEQPPTGQQSKLPVAARQNASSHLHHFQKSFRQAMLTQQHNALEA